MSESIRRDKEKVVMRVNWCGYDVEVELDEDDIREFEREFTVKMMG